MVYTPQDSESVIGRQKQEIEHLTNRLLQSDNWRNQQEKAWGYIRQALDEAIGLTETAGAFLPSTDKKTATFKAELVKMGQVFRERRRNFEDVLKGYPVAETSGNESVSGDVGEGQKPKSAKQKHAGDGRKTTSSVDN